MSTVTNGALLALGEGKSPETADASVDQRTLAARQIRVYIDNTRDYSVFAFVGFTLAFLMLWLVIPDEHPKMVLWGVACLVTFLARLAAWVAFVKAKPKDEVIFSWLKWFFVPQLCGMTIVGAAPILFLPASAGNDGELTFAFGMLAATTVYVALHAAAYRPLILPATAMSALIIAIGFIPLPGTLPKLLARRTPAHAGRERHAPLPGREGFHLPPRRRRVPPHG